MSQSVNYTLRLTLPDGSYSDVAELVPNGAGAASSPSYIDSAPYQINISGQQKDGYYLVKADVTALEEAACYLSICGKYENGEAYTFSGKQDFHEIFRQSPHDVNCWILDMAKQAVPMAAVKTADGFDVVMSNAPAFYDNYTTQELKPDQKTFLVSSGDSGERPGYQGKVSFSPYYDTVSPSKSHCFEAIIFHSPADSLADLRLDVFRAIEAVWGSNTSRYHSICFGSNYMHLRKNERGSSTYWIVPGIDYGNVQYIRDSFWQSFILPPQYQEECYRALTPSSYTSAENPMICLIWSYRILRMGGTPIRECMEYAMKVLQKEATEGRGLTSNKMGTPDFRSWFDLCAHEDDDIVTYNQGLYAVAMHAAAEMGLADPSEYLRAREIYRGLFSKKEGVYPLSSKKMALVVDPLVGDLLSYLLFDEPLLPDDDVLSHYSIVCQRSKTPYGIKVVADMNGDFPPVELFGIPGYINSYYAEDGEKGKYIWGSSYFIYEMLFHIDAYLHGAPHAEDNIIERTLLDFSIGSTYFEHINTVTGEGGKPNQGWNAAIYAIWQTLMDEGKASSRYFDAVETYLDRNR